jgi:hypothetical protein
MPVGTHPHLLMVGFGNPIAVPCLVMQLGGASRHLRSVRSITIEKAMYGGLLKIIYTHYTSHDLPLGISDMFFRY